MGRGVVGGVWLLGALVALLASPAEAQWKVHIAGRGEPLEAAFYAEEAPWVFFRFRDDQSMYLFTLGCDRVTRVERDGSELPLLNCPLPRLPTTMPRIYGDIIERESKLFDDTWAKLVKEKEQQEKTIGGVPPGAAETAAERERRRQLDQRSREIMERQIARTERDLDSIDRRIDALVLAVKAYPPSEKPRYFFFRR